MSKQNLKIRNFITPGDIFGVLVIVAGLIVAMSFEETAIRMIGVSISILGAVLLFMLISQRLSDVVETRYPKTGTTQPEFTMTTTKDSAAKRQTVEDFSRSFGGEDDFPVSAPVITKSDTIEPLKKEPDSDNPEKGQNPKSKDPDYTDGFSGMRIVGKVKPVYKEHPTAGAQQSVSKQTGTKPQTAEKNINIHESEIKPVPHLISEKPVTPKVQQTEQPRLIPLEAEIPEDIVQPVNEPEIKPMMAINEIRKEDEPVPVSKYMGKVIDLPVNVFMETDQLVGDEPRKEFEYFMTRVLTIIRSSTDTRTALFMIFNASNEELILESYVTSVPIALKPKLRYRLGSDIVSQIVANAKPQILSEINPAAELDLIPYYNTNTATGSLIGVPVYWGEGVVGVIIADSESTNAYDASTVAFLGHFTKLIGALVKSYTHKYDLLQASKTLEAINTFYLISSNSRSGNENISESIADSLKALFPNAVAGLCGFDGETDSWRIKSYRGAGKDCTGQIINIDNSFIGQSIYECRTIHVNSGESSGQIRVTENEQPLNGEFVAVPIKSATQIYGAIYLELSGRENFTEFDISVIELIGQHAGNSIERLYLLESLQTSAIIDHQTGLLNPVAFYRRIQEELSRAKDFKTTLTLCFFSFDKYASLDPENFPNRFEYTMHVILERMKRYIKDYDLYGSVDESTYGILFVGRDSNQSRMTAERIRADVANTIIEHGGGKFSVTISMGMVSPGIEYDIDSLIRDAQSGLERASASGNQVQVFY